MVQAAPRTPDMEAKIDMLPGIKAMRKFKVLES